MNERIRRLEWRLRGPEGVIRRIVRAEQATAEDLESSTTLVVSFKTVYAGPQEGPTQERKVENDRNL